MLKAKDIMKKDVISVRRETPIFEAIEVLLKNEITGMPVVEDGMRLAGILTEKDVLRLFCTYEAEQNKTVEDFMTEPAIYFDENESLSEICICLTDSIFRRVPVTSNGKVVGIISRPDIVEHILQQSSKKTAPAENAK